MTDRTTVVLVHLNSELVLRLHPYITIQAPPKSAGYLVSWIGEPTVEEMRNLVAEIIAEVHSPLDPADAAYKRTKLDLQALATEAMQTTCGIDKATKAELRADLMERLRRHKEHGGVAEVMGFMRTIRQNR